MTSTREIDAFKGWFAGLKGHSNTGGLPAKGTIAAGLVVLERLKANYELDLDAHLAEGKAQIQGLNPSSLKKILAAFGETRPFSTEAGRTNRGGPGEMKNMLEVLRGMELDKIPPDTRLEILTDLQEFLVEKVREYHNRKRLEVSYDPAKTTWSAVHELLQQAEAVGKAGPVAQYLVGAKLTLRFPAMTVSNDRYSSADVQTHRHGDFEVGNTAFHVTVSPVQGVFDKCKRNLSEGLRVYLLVPDDKLVGTRQNAHVSAPHKIAVESIESFVSNNVEELSSFATNQLVGGFRKLLETYNKRTDDVELDKSMLIDIPRNLQ